MKQFCSFGEKLSFFIVIKFVRCKVEFLIVRLDLPEIGYEHHIESKCIADAIFQVHAAFVQKPGFCIFRFGLIVRSQIGAERQSYRWFYVFNTGELAFLMNKSRNGSVNEIP